jgi:hypothetical protein
VVRCVEGAKDVDEGMTWIHVSHTAPAAIYIYIYMSPPRAIFLPHHSKFIHQLSLALINQQQFKARAGGNSFE